MYMCAVRMNDTMDAISGEYELLSLNLLNWGVLLEQFVTNLSCIMQWDDVIKKALAMNPSLGDDKRYGTVQMFAHHLLGVMDFSDDPTDVESLKILLGRASSHWMNTYFNRLDPKHVVWFQVLKQNSKRSVFNGKRGR